MTTLSQIIGVVLMFLGAFIAAAVIPALVSDYRAVKRARRISDEVEAQRR